MPRPIDQWKKPSNIRIDRMEETEKLYRLEHLRSEAIRAAANELAVVLGHDGEKDYWKVTMPQALFDVLDSFELAASYQAAKAFVESYEKTHPDMFTIDVDKEKEKR